MNPFADTSKVYTPTGNGVMEYAPAPVVVRIVATPVAVLVAVTVALGIEAPVLSVTVPAIAPWPPTCAMRCSGMTSSTIAASAMVLPIAEHRKSRETWDSFVILSLAKL